MAKIGLIRCEKNENRCPLTGCIKSLKDQVQGFAGYDETELVGVFACRCPGEDLVEKAKILKSKGAETLHFCTCIFSSKEDGKWVLGNGFCDQIDALIKKVATESGIDCVKGTAHIPEGFQPEVIYPE